MLAVAHGLAGRGGHTSAREAPGGEVALHAAGRCSAGRRHGLKILDNLLDRAIGLDVEGDDALLLGDVVEQHLAHRVAPGAQVGLCGVGELGHASRAREGVAGTAALGIAGPQHHIVVVTGVAVHLVARPHVKVAHVDARHKHAVARQIAVPLGALSVFEIEGGGGLLRGQDVAMVGSIERAHGVVLAGLQRVGGGKAQHSALKERVAHRVAAIVVVAAASHHLPGARVVALASALAIVGVVEVFKTQHVAELVAYRAYAVVLVATLTFPAVVLTRAGVAAQVDAVVGLRAVVGQRRHVGPQVAAVVAAVVGGVPCHNEVDHVDRAVAVGVVLAEVDRAVELIDGRKENTGVILVTIGRSIVDVDRAIDVEMGVEDAIGVVVEVIAHAARVGLIAAVDRDTGEILVVECCLIESAVDSKLAVAIVDQDNQAAKLAVVEQVVAQQLAAGVAAACFRLLALAPGVDIDQEACCGLQRGRLGSSACCGIVGHDAGSHQAPAALGGIHIGTLGILDDGVAVERGVEVVVFIALQHERERAAVGLGHSSGCGTCGYCHGTHCREQAHEQQEKFLHEQ